jgi:hypothetical protein
MADDRPMFLRQPPTCDLVVRIGLFSTKLAISWTVCRILVARLPFATLGGSAQAFGSNASTSDLLNNLLDEEWLGKIKLCGEVERIWRGFMGSEKVRGSGTQG